LSLTSITRALLQDTEVTNGNLVKGSTINLKIGDNDPSTVSFIFNNVKPGEVREFMVPVASVGGMSGNFWMEVLTSNSQEGDNPESETDITGEGELDDCAEISVTFDNSDALTALSKDWTPANAVGTLETFWGNNVDAWVGVKTARMHLLLRNDNCGPDAMGDQFNLNLSFHLDQV
jgi:hypothetical protein